MIFTKENQDELSIMESIHSKNKIKQAYKTKWELRYNSYNWRDPNLNKPKEKSAI